MICVRQFIAQPMRAVYLLRIICSSCSGPVSFVLANIYRAINRNFAYDVFAYDPLCALDDCNNDIFTNMFYFIGKSVQIIY